MPQRPKNKNKRSIRQLMRGRETASQMYPLMSLPECECSGGRRGFLRSTSRPIEWIVGANSTLTTRFCDCPPLVERAMPIDYTDFLIDMLCLISVIFVLGSCVCHYLIYRRYR